MSSVTHIDASSKFTPPDRDSHWSDHPPGPSFRKFSPGSMWQPAVNISEDRTCYYVVVDLAGMSASDIELEFQDGALILTGQRQTPVPTDGESCGRMHVMEIDHGQFMRKIKLPTDADTEAITAGYKCGFLTIQVPRRG